jgi:hypothetical protein
MRWELMVACGLASIATRPVQAGVTRDNFVANSAQDLVALCTVTEDDPLRLAAVGFCQGYVFLTEKYPCPTGKKGAKR